MNLKNLNKNLIEPVIREILRGRKLKAYHFSTFTCFDINQTLRSQPLGERGRGQENNLKPAYDIFKASLKSTKHANQHFPISLIKDKHFLLLYITGYVKFFSYTDYSFFLEWLQYFKFIYRCVKTQHLANNNSINNQWLRIQRPLGNLKEGGADPSLLI